MKHKRRDGAYIHTHKGIYKVDCENSSLLPCGIKKERKKEPLNKRKCRMTTIQKMRGSKIINCISRRVSDKKDSSFILSQLSKSKRSAFSDCIPPPPFLLLLNCESEGIARARFFHFTFWWRLTLCHSCACVSVNNEHFNWNENL